MPSPSTTLTASSPPPAQPPTERRASSISGEWPSPAVKSSPMPPPSLISAASPPLSNAHRQRRSHCNLGSQSFSNVTIAGAFSLCLQRQTVSLGRHDYQQRKHHVCLFPEHLFYQQCLSQRQRNSRYRRRIVHHVSLRFFVSKQRPIPSPASAPSQTSSTAEPSSPTRLPTPC